MNKFIVLDYDRVVVLMAEKTLEHIEEFNEWQRHNQKNPLVTFEKFLIDNGAVYYDGKIYNMPLEVWNAYETTTTPF